MSVRVCMYVSVGPSSFGWELSATECVSPEEHGNGGNIAPVMSMWSMTWHLGPRPVSISKRKKRCLLSSAERGRFHGARSSVAESDRPPVLLLGTSHMIGEIVMTAEAEAAAVCLRGCEAICRPSVRWRTLWGFAVYVGMAAPTGEGSIIGLKS